MAWDPERYREKREKVLGIQKRGVSFGSLTAIIGNVQNSVSRFRFPDLPQRQRK
ncbi:MAG: hypothetical protein HUN05_18730 [Desulfobacter sp.]|nr:MAG: hypothetical protein HUN05_18730 [Desulfobacter sp.]